jgi:hypothetical protein
MVGVAWLLCAGALASAKTISARTYECDDLEARLASLESARAALLHEIEIRRCITSAPSPLLLVLPLMLRSVSPSVTAWARCAGAYVFGESGSDSCPAGSITISTAAACEAAAAATALAYDGSESESGYPAGCYRVTDGDGDSIVFFNTHVTGGSNANSQPLCTPEGSAGIALPLDVATVRRRVFIGAFAAAVPASAAPTNIGDTRAPMTALPSGTPTG